MKQGSGSQMSLFEDWDVWNAYYPRTSYVWNRRIQP